MTGVRGQDTGEVPERSRPSAMHWLVAVVLLGLTASVWFFTARPGPRAVLWRTWWPSSMLINLAVTAAALGLIYVLLGPGQRRLRLLRATLLGFVLALCLFLVEAPVLFGDHDWGVSLGDDPRQVWLQRAAGINLPDPELIHIHRPGSSWEGEVPGNLAALGIPRPRRYAVSVRYDDHGFRNDTTHEKARVVVIGDSFVEGAILPREEGLTARLEQQLGTPVVNLGQAAYGLKQELAVLKRFALPLEPRVVVWCFFGGNDLRDVETYERQRKQFGQPRPPRPRDQRLFTVNALKLLSRLTVSELEEAEPDALTRSGIFRGSGGGEDRVWFGQTNGPWNEPQWKVMSDVLTEAGRLCQEAGARLLVTYIPRKFRVYREFIETRPDSLIATWKVNDLPQAMASWCQEKGLAFIDFTKRLRDEVAAGRHPYLLDDVHWNARGHELAAESVAAWIEARKLHQPRPR